MTPGLSPCTNGPAYAMVILNTVKINQIYNTKCVKQASNELGISGYSLKRIIREDKPVIFRVRPNANFPAGALF